MNFSVAAGNNINRVLSAAVNDSGHRKLTDAAQQFEGMLLQEMLKPLRGHGFCQGDEQTATEEDSGGDTLASFGTEVMATAIAKAGGLGIAQRVVAQVEGEKISHEKVTGRRAGAHALPK